MVDIDLSRSNAYQQKNLTRGSIIKIIYDSIIKSSKDFGLRTVDKQIEKYIKTNKFKIDKILSYEHIPVAIFESEDNYAKLADFVMELPQKIYEDNSDKLKGVFIFIDEIQLIKDLDNVGKFLWYMRSFIQNQKNVAYLFCGSMSLKDSLINDLNGKEGAFGGRMLTIEIHPFQNEQHMIMLNHFQEIYCSIMEDLKDFTNVHEEYPITSTFLQKFFQKTSF